MRICKLFHDLTRDIVRELVMELRRVTVDSRRQGSRHYAADDEAEHATPRRRLFKSRAIHPGVNRRTPYENTLSVVTFLLTLVYLLK